MRRLILVTGLLLLCGVAAIAQLRLSTGAVRDYKTNGCNGIDLPLTIPEADNFRAWYSFGGFPIFTQWTNKNVWGSDFRDGAASDMDASGGSDMADIYFFTGHGTCQNPPNANSPDFIVACSPNGQPDSTNIGTSTRWGNNGGRLKFAFIDASCPMDLVSLTTQWWSVFQGLHLAMGHSGDVGHDNLDSSVKLPTIGFYLGFGNSYRAAWMAAGLIDVQSGVCAVITGTGRTEAEAVSRRDFETPLNRKADALPANWIAWRWVCK